MDKGRIAALSDGIVAIAATIMALELAVPEVLSMESLRGQFPTFFAYFVSFTLIYLGWRSHHNAFQKAERINSAVFLTNGLWLLLVSLIPFATGLIGRHPDSSIAAVVYVLVVGSWTLSFQFLDIAVTKANPDAPKDEVRAPVARVILFGGYALSLVLAFFVPRAPLFVIALSSLVMGIRIIKGNR